MRSFIKGIAFLMVSICLPALLTAQTTKEQIDSLKQKLLTARDDTGKITLLIQLGNNEGYYDGAKALQYGHDALILSKKLHNVEGEGRAAYLIGMTAMDMGNFSLSDSFLTIAEKNAPFGGKGENLARINNARGSLNFMQGNYYLASDYYSKAANYFEGTTDTLSAIIAFQNLIAVLAEVKNYQRAVALSRKLLPIIIAREDTLSLGYCYQALTTDLIYLDSLKAAETYMQQLIPIAETTIDNNLSSDAFSTIGTFYYFKKDFSRALPYFMKAVEKAELLGNKFQLTNHIKSVGSTYLQLGNLQLAKKYLDQALRLANENHNTRAVYNASIDLSNYFEKVNDPKQALSFLKQHLELKDSIMGTETRNYTSYLEQQFESNKKENEILRLQKSEQQKSFELRQRNILFLTAAGLLAVIVVISILVYKNQLTKQKIAKQNRLMQEERIQTLEKQQQVLSLQSMINGQETERTRIARDLHDGLGGIFSTVKMHYSTLQHDVPEVRANALYRKTFELINEASDELRKVAHNMMPEVLMKLGLVEALKDFCNNINAARLLQLSLQVYGMEKRLSGSTEIMLYRIIQELVNNIMKHADATEAIIQFNRNGNQLTIVVEDNGRGFDTIEAEEKRTMGIAGVRNRVDYLNGKLTIDSRKDVGTTVMIDILLNEN